MKLKNFRIILLFFLIPIFALIYYFVSDQFNDVPVWHMVNCNDRSHQADCHLLLDNGVITLVDLGDERESDRFLIPFLLSNEIDNIDHVFISHPHTDHYGGLKSLLKNNINVDNIYYNMPPDGVFDWNYTKESFSNTINNHKQRGASLFDIEKGFELQLPTSKIVVLVAEKEVQHGGVNDYSIIMRWETSHHSSLFTGDLSSALGEKLSTGSQFSADVLKIPHHGASSIAPNSFFENVNPSIIMIPGHKELWLHERSSQVVEWSIKRFEKHNTLICHNAYNGIVSLFFHKKGIEVVTQRESNKCPQGQITI